MPAPRYRGAGDSCAMCLFFLAWIQCDATSFGPSVVRSLRVVENLVVRGIVSYVFFDVLANSIFWPLPLPPCRGTDIDPRRLAMSKTATTDRWLSVAEIAQHLGVKPTSIYKWITHNGTPAYKAGRLWKFMVDKVDATRNGGKLIGR